MVAMKMALGRCFTRHPIGYVDGMNVYASVHNDPVNCVDPLGLETAGRGHMYPVYLGGSSNQPVFEVNERQHTAMHDYLRDKGLLTYNEDYKSASQRAWASLSDKERRSIVKEGMRKAEIPEGEINKHIDDIMAGETPGVAQERKYGRLITEVDLDAARAAEAGAGGRKIAAAESKALGRAESKLVKVAQTELETLARVGGKVKSTATSAAMAGIMLTVAATNTFASEKSTREWFGRTHSVLQRLAAGQVVPNEEIDEISNGKVYKNAMAVLSNAAGEAGGSEGAMGYLKTAEYFEAAAREVQDRALAANKRNAVSAENKD